MSESRTLVVSDLHLHAGSEPSVAKDLVRLLGASPADLLVINGDFFDLDRVAGEKHAGIGSRRAVLSLTSMGRPSRCPSGAAGQPAWAGFSSASSAGALSSPPAA